MFTPGYAGAHGHVPKALPLKPKGLGYAAGLLPVRVSLKENLPQPLSC
jgi:hypothetical protein